MFRKLDLAFRIKIYIFCVRGWGGVWANKGGLIILTVDVIYRLQSCAFPKEERKVSVDMLGNSSSVCRSTGRQWQVQLEAPPNQVVTLFNSRYFTNHLRGGNGFVSLLKWLFNSSSLPECAWMSLTNETESKKWIRSVVECYLFMRICSKEEEGEELENVSG